MNQIGNNDGGEFRTGPNQESLPIHDYRVGIVDSVKNSPVTIITAETGAGKSTQVPQFLADEGYEVIVTQPRIVAARTVAQRVAEEMKTDFGGRVGYVTAQERTVSSSTDVLFCTDGLQVVKSLSGRSRPKGSKPQVLVLDEVHEWNTNMEVLVAWAKQRAQEDPENFKVVLMSATMEADRLSEYFGESHCSEVISVPGRTFDVAKSFVETRPDLDSIIIDVALTAGEKALEDNGKNVLVFLPGVAEIVTARRLLSDSDSEGRLSVLPMHGKLTKEEQGEVFKKSARPKVILATNVAQTSITISDVDVVVDSGLERRIEVNAGIEGLKLNPISRADCLQRAGRAGRTKNGEYVLVSPVDLDRRSEYPTPEIQRSRLDKLVLKLARNGFDATKLEFFHQPDKKEIDLAVTTLHNMGALDSEGKVTEIGKEMDKYPVEAHYARMLVEAKKHGIEGIMAMVIGLMDGGDIRWRADAEKATQYMNCSSSDPIAQLQLYLNALDKKPYELRDMGINQKAFNLAKQKIRQLSGALRAKIPTPADVLSLLNDKNTVEAVGKSVAAGMIDRLYRCSSGDWYDGSDGNQRLLGDQSVVSNCNKWIVGDPFNIQTRRGGTLPLITNVTAVDPAWLMEVAPHLVEWKPNTYGTIGFAAISGRAERVGMLTFAGHEVKPENLPVGESDSEAIEKVLEAVWNKIQYNDPQIYFYLNEARSLGEQLSIFDPKIKSDILEHLKQMVIERMRSSGSLNLNHILANPPQLQPEDVLTDEFIERITAIESKFPKTLSLGGEELLVEYSRSFYYHDSKPLAKVNIREDQIYELKTLIESLSENMQFEITVASTLGDTINGSLDYCLGEIEDRRQAELIRMTADNKAIRDTLQSVVKWEKVIECIYASAEIKGALTDLGFKTDFSEALSNGSLAGPEGIQIYEVPLWIKDEAKYDLLEASERGIRYHSTAVYVVIARSLPSRGYIEVLTNASVSGATRYFYLRFAGDDMPEGYPVLEDDLSAQETPKELARAEHNPDTTEIDLSGLIK